jgi:hypothetical protein
MFFQVMPKIAVTDAGKHVPSNLIYTILPLKLRHMLTVAWGACCFTTCHYHINQRQQLRMLPVAATCSSCLLPQNHSSTSSYG